MPYSWTPGFGGRPGPLDTVERHGGELVVISLLPVSNVVSQHFKLATKTAHGHFYDIKVASLGLPGTPACSVPIRTPSIHDSGLRDDKH